MTTASQWWTLARTAIQGEQWPVAEGALLRLTECHGPHPELLDLLGYALLMQGQFVRCEAVIRQALELGTTNFWTPHKLGDALRGQQRLAESVEGYEQALDWGSDSPLTVRNLLEALYGLDGDLALRRLEAFAAASTTSTPGLEGVRHLTWEQPLPWQEGALAAAKNTAGPDLAQWLSAHGCPDPWIRRLAWEEALFTLELPTIGMLLSARGDEQVQALRQRLHHLLFRALQG